MLPRDLKAENFSGYPPMGRNLVTQNIEVLRVLPLSMLPNLLREAIDYDYEFPVERRALELELENLRSLSTDQREKWLAGFFAIQLSPALERLDWVNSPGQFVEQLAAHLWSSHQQDAFRKAAIEYGSRLEASVPSEAPPIPRLGISVIGEGVASNDVPLFETASARCALSKGKSRQRLAGDFGFRANRERVIPVRTGTGTLTAGRRVHTIRRFCVSYRACSRRELNS